MKAMIPLLEQLTAGKAPDEFVLTRGPGRPVRKPKKDWVTLFRKAGLDGATLSRFPQERGQGNGGRRHSRHGRDAAPTKREAYSRAITSLPIGTSPPPWTGWNRSQMDHSARKRNA